MCTFTPALQLVDPLRRYYTLLRLIRFNARSDARSDALICCLKRGLKVILGPFRPLLYKLLYIAMNDVRVTICILTFALLGGFVCRCESQGIYIGYCCNVYANTIDVLYIIHATTRGLDYVA